VTTARRSTGSATRKTSSSARRARASAATGAAGAPRPELRIVETRVYRGPNYWNYEPAIKLIVDLGILEQFPSNAIPGFVDGLLDMLPGIAQHSCGTGKVGGFEDRLREGTWAGHVAELDQ
jgi:cyanophycin synthetase